MPFIPVIDISSCGLDNKKSWDAAVAELIGKKLVDALSTFGFVYLTNSGIHQEFIDEVNKVTGQFFTSNLEDKKRYLREPSLNFGYVCLEMERVNPLRPSDYKEAFNISSGILDDTSIKWPNDLSPQFSGIIKQCMEQCKLLTNIILRLIGIGLKLKDSDYLVKCHSLIHQKGNQTTLRSLYYPPLPSNMKQNQVRLGEHSDYGSITLLFQDNIGGLQVQNMEDQYIDATPINDTVLINIGDLLEFWSNGKLRSTKHRVLNPDDDLKRNTIRRSLVYFVHPNDDVLVNEKFVYSDSTEPADDIISSDNEITALDYLKQKFSTSF